MYKFLKKKIFGVLRKISRANEILVHTNELIARSNELNAKLDVLTGMIENLQRETRDIAQRACDHDTVFAGLGSKLNTVFDYTKSVQDSVHILTRNLASHPEGKIKIGFLVHNIEAWGSCESIYYEALKNPHTEPVVFSCNRSYYGVDFRDEDLISAELDKKNIPHIRLNDQDSFKDLEIMKSTGIHALFRQSHWQPDLPPAFQNSFLNFCNLYYISYEIASVPQFGLQFRYSFYEKLCKKVFVASELIKKEQDGLPGAEKVDAIVTGHPKMIKVLSAVPEWPIHTGNKVRIIWSAHHSVGTGWNNYGVFDHIYPSMLGLAQKHPEWDILFSPHPALLHRIQSITDPTLSNSIQDFFTSWNSLPNTDIIKAGNYVGAFKESTLLIVDGLSFLVEYQPNLKPIIHLTRPDTGPLSQFGQRVMNGVHKLSYMDIDKLENTIYQFLDTTDDPLRPQQEILVKELCAHTNPAKEIVSEIVKDFSLPPSA